MIFDEPISPEFRQQFVSQVGHLTPAQVSQVKACLQGDQSPEFMEGLLAGLAGAHQIFPGGNALLKVVIAVIAEEIALEKHR